MIKKYRYSFFVVVLAFGCWLTTDAQIAVEFSAPIEGQTLEGLSNAKIINSLSVDVTGVLTITVKETNSQSNVITIKTTPFTTHPGIQNINRTAFINATYIFGNNNYGLTLSQARRFPEGEYEYCFEIDISASKLPQISPVYDNCFIQQIQPLTPLLLIDPIDGDKTCNKRPNFLWQPPMPMPVNGRFRLVLSELKDKQDEIEAVTYNQPIINQFNIPVNSLLYPNNAPELIEGKKYAWQVTLYEGKTILKKSELWTFQIACQEEIKQPGTDSYRELREDDNGFYIANNVLRFSLNNPYSAGSLNYSISSLNDPNTTIKNLPKLKLYNGSNKYDVDLSDNREFKDGEEYLLKVRLTNNRAFSLRFIYRKE